jgi:putative membrane protein
MEPPAGGTFDHDGDATRRTWLANERTWLAWWRTALTAFGIALAVGRVIPELSGSERAPYAVMGAGYAVLGILLLVYGQRRQRAVDRAVRTGGYVLPSAPFMLLLTTVGALLGAATLVLVFID